METRMIWKIISIVEFAAVIVVVLLDLFIPSLVIIGLMAVSLLIRREHISIMGFKRPGSWLVLIGVAFGVALLLQLFDFGVSMPILNRLTGKTMDFGDVANLKGNTQQLLFILAYSWTIAAVGEELAFRGYLQKVLGDLFGVGTIGVLLTVIISSVLFGLLHTEQGLIGVIVCTVDALIFSLVKRKFNNNLWASILTHGFYNTIGAVVVFFTGPISGLW